MSQIGELILLHFWWLHDNANERQLQQSNRKLVCVLALVCISAPGGHLLLLQKSATKYYDA